MAFASFCPEVWAHYFNLPDRAFPTLWSLTHWLSMGEIMRLLSVFLLLFISASASAEAPKISSVINLYGVTFQYGAPPWISKGENLLKEVKPYRQQRGNDFVFELIPAAESFDSWKTLFAINAGRINRVIPAKMWKDYNLTTFKSVCWGFKEKILSMDDNTALVQITCPRVVGKPLMKGYEGGVGEIGIFAFMVVGNVLINHHLEWRGHGFDPDDKASWPATQEQIDKGIKLMQSVKAMKGNMVVSFDPS
ncbi:hypothetical protein [Kordiimonas marina]|uniref:hypothetical protein n=1 Tax=Kordiimonas marina TaxID=2872312 RepID=UPI001FF2B9F2|nr:hypothetical protein [Kordiimonas marina]MCJ9430710.1 hypothetical protein [Kordiimonas marina]